MPQDRPISRAYGVDTVAFCRRNDRAVDDQRFGKNGAVQSCGPACSERSSEGGEGHVISSSLGVEVVDRPIGRNDGGPDGGPGSGGCSL